MSNQLSVVERGSLRKHEAVIEKGMATFIEVGMALKTIRDDGLYRESFKTFEKYVSERWGMARQRAYQLIDAAEVKADLSTIVDKIPRLAEINKESQLRELVDVPTENLSEVIEKAVEIADGEKITAKIIHEAKVELLELEEEEPEQDTKAKPATMTKAEQAVFNASVLKEIIKSLQQAKRLAKAVEQIPGMEMFLARQLSIEREIESAKQAVSVTIPHSVCVRCKGKGCPHCGNHGWVNSVMAEQLEHVK